jgi:hypothetical protein
MERLLNRSQHQVNTVHMSFKRYLSEQIDWNERLIAIKGARGTGKTTLMLQYIKENIKDDILYISLDDIFFTENSLIDVIDDFVKNGGKFFFLDEIHKYPHWSREIKNIYDTYPEIKIIFSGSSILEIDKGEADLSRRAVKYNLHELSLREYISLIHKINIPVYSLEEIINNHIDITKKINELIKPIRFFKEFLEFGSYPYIIEGKNNFHDKLRWSINLIIENDLPSSASIAFESIFKLKKLLMLISHSVPFKPNISELSNKINTSRDNLIKYLNLLHNARLITLLTANAKPTGYLTKPEKIYLNNTALLYALNDTLPEIGTLREIFFVQHLSQKHNILYTKQGDFLIDGKYTFEIGGKNKSFSQIKGLDNSFVAADDIEFGYKNKIPLWLFGFIY